MPLMTVQLPADCEWEQLLECPIDLISVGPEREQAIIVNPIF